MTLRKLFLAVLTLAVLIVAPGCDSDSNDETSDADAFVGTWNAVGVADDTGDQTALFAQAVSQFQVNFKSNGTYDLDVDFTDERPTISFDNGSYSVNESLKQITITIPGAATPTGQDLPLIFGYNIVSNNRIELSNAAQIALINLLFGTSYSGTVTITVAK